MDLRVDRASPLPLGAQLAARLRAEIDAGRLGPGTRLPSIREVASEAGVNVNTVRAVYARLEADGVVTSEQGRGTFVDSRAPAGGRAARRELRRQIELLEAQVVRLPAPRPESEPPAPPPAAAGLLSTEQLAAVRDDLLDRLRELDAARGEVVRRLERLELRDAEAQAGAPARRSSSTLAGARVRWVGA